jgi:hypothetical protein
LGRAFLDGFSDSDSESGHGAGALDYLDTQEVREAVAEGQRAHVEQLEIILNGHFDAQPVDTEPGVAEPDNNAEAPPPLRTRQLGIGSDVCKACAAKISPPTMQSPHSPKAVGHW